MWKTSEVDKIQLRTNKKNVNNEFEWRNIVVFIGTFVEIIEKNINCLVEGIYYKIEVFNDN